MALEMILFLVALLPVLWRAWSGWKTGAAVELRYTIAGVFALLVSLRYWYRVSSVLAEYIPLDPQYLTAGVCVALFLAGFALAALIVNLNGEIFQNVFSNPLDHVLGVVAGLVSGAVIGCSILLTASVALPGKVDNFAAGNYPVRLDQYPGVLFRAIEQNVAHIEQASTARTPLPVMETTELSPTEKRVTVSWK